MQGWSSTNQADLNLAFGISTTVLIEIYHPYYHWYPSTSYLRTQHRQWHYLQTAIYLKDITISLLVNLQRGPISMCNGLLSEELLICKEKSHDCQPPSITISYGFTVEH